MRAIFPAVALILSTVLAMTPAHASTDTVPVPLPNSMASTGDSITRAFDIGWLHLLSDSPQYSWSTGDSSAVDSQYERILARNPAIVGHEYNDAKTGADMADLDRQVTLAASQHVQYLTVLIGANDVCTSSIASMTPTTTFQTEFERALADFFAADPTAHIYVSSLPNIYQLWLTLRDNLAAEATWQVFHICQSMLSLWNTDAQRQAVVAQEVADNKVLARVCARYANCRWDRLAGYNYRIPATEVSTVDYFHPNRIGQNDIARLTWSASYWGS